MGQRTSRERVLAALAHQEPDRPPRLLYGGVIGYVTPPDKLEGRPEAILAERKPKMQAARERRATMWHRSSDKPLTSRREETISKMFGETEAGPLESAPRGIADRADDHSSRGRILCLPPAMAQRRAMLRGSLCLARLRSLGPPPRIL